MIMFFTLASFGIINITFAKGKSSDYYKDVVFQAGGDFLSLTLGDSREVVLSKMPEEALEENTGSYLYYTWDLNKYDYYIDLYFNDTDELGSIDGYVYFFDKNEKGLMNEADKLYKVMKVFLQDK